mmetsp:Transcript_23371/g.55245  ORF Transcript_23371/g.55245 Transcript_23371/m.55245 type:complete len:94 (+) Transcript_23371:889-1170(+)
MKVTFPDCHVEWRVSILLISRIDPFGMGMENVLNLLQVSQIDRMQKVLWSGVVAHFVFLLFLVTPAWGEVFASRPELDTELTGRNDMSALPPF